MDYHRMNNVPVRIVRIFNTYGPRMHPYDGRVVSNFIRQAMQGEDITVFGDGSQTRSFCYRDDLVEGLVRMMEVDDDDFVGPVNIGNPDEFTIMQLAQLVLELTGSRSRLVRRPLPADDPTRRCPDISLARQRLQWTPTTQLREGLAATIQWFRGLDLDQFRPPTPNYVGRDPSRSARAERGPSSGTNRTTSGPARLAGPTRDLRGTYGRRAVQASMAA